MKNEEKWYSDFGEYTIDEYVTERILGNPAEMERFAQIIQHVPNDAVTLLDVGCGPGVFLHFLYKRKNIKGIGIEISDNKVTYAREQLHVAAEKGEAGNLRFESRSFDVVTALEVIEHLPYGIYERALQEMARVAKKAIIISVPNNENRKFMTCPYCGTKFNASYHMRSFHEDMLDNLFPGFKIEKIEKTGADKQLPVALQELIGLLRKGHTSNEFACPACGFSKPSAKMNKANQVESSRNILRHLWKIVPKQTKARWLVAIYNRTE